MVNIGEIVKIGFLLLLLIGVVIYLITNNAA